MPFVTLVHESAAKLEPNGRSNVENSGTCPTCVPRDRCLHSTFGRTMQLMSFPTQTLGDASPVPNGLTPLPPSLIV